MLEKYIHSKPKLDIEVISLTSDNQFSGNIKVNEKELVAIS